MEACSRCVSLASRFSVLIADGSVLVGAPVFVPRVLEVVKSQLCWVVGTVYMDMPLKPNVMEDIARDVSPQRKNRSTSFTV